MTINKDEWTVLIYEKKSKKQELLDQGWEFHGVEWSDYPYGIMISPELSVHDDWMDCIKEWDDYLETPVSYYLDYIENLFNSPVFAGDNDWSDHIIELREQKDEKNNHRN